MLSEERIAQVITNSNSMNDIQARFKYTAKLLNNCKKIIDDTFRGIFEKYKAQKEKEVFKQSYNRIDLILKNGPYVKIADYMDRFILKDISRAQYNEQDNTFSIWYEFVPFSTRWGETLGSIIVSGEPLLIMIDIIKEMADREGLTIYTKHKELNDNEIHMGIEFKISAKDLDIIHQHPEILALTGSIPETLKLVRNKKNTNKYNFI